MTPPREATRPPGLDFLVVLGTKSRRACITPGPAQHQGLALSGRSKDKLLALRDELDVDWPVLVADAADAGSLAELAASTTAVATTVGPFAKHGLPLVRACAAGTSYADLTGEVLFVRNSAAAAHDRVRETGARIVHAAGIDSSSASVLRRQ